MYKVCVKRGALIAFWQMLYQYVRHLRAIIYETNPYVSFSLIVFISVN